MSRVGYTEERILDRRDAITATLGLIAADLPVAALSAPAAPRAAPGPVTAAERAVGVATVLEGFVPGDVRRYGALGDGQTDDAVAWRTALATGHRVLGGGPEHVYCFDSAIPVTRRTFIDLEGATIRPRGEGRGFVRTPPAPSVTSVVSAGASPGSRSLTLQSSSGFAPGQWLRLDLNDAPAHDASSYPPCWTRVTAVHGSTVELGTPLQVGYGGGELHALAYQPELFYEHFECCNGTFDGSQGTFDKDTGQALRIGGCERVVVRNCQFRNFRHGGQLTCAVQLFTNIDAVVSDCAFTGGVSHFDICDIQTVRFAHFINNQIQGSHFGCNLTRADFALFANNALQGERTAEGAAGIDPPRSVRGLKAYGCACIRVLGNHCADYESPIKIEACFRYDVSHNTIFNAGLGPDHGQIALNIGSIHAGRNMRLGRIIGNHVETCGGIGIGVTTDPTGGLVLADNIVRTTQAAGIHVGVPNAIVCGNRVEDWGLRGGSDAAIHVTGGATVANNRFAHGNSTRVPCLSTDGNDARLIVRDNVSESGNPLGVRAS